MTALAIMGAAGLAIGLALLLSPIGYVGRASCGSVLSPRQPSHDSVAAASCRDLRASHRDAGALFAGVGLPVALAAGGRALWCRRTLHAAPGLS
jgi:hypothetical protein